MEPASDLALMRVLFSPIGCNMLFQRPMPKYAWPSPDGWKQSTCARISEVPVLPVRGSVDEA